MTLFGAVRKLLDFIAGRARVKYHNDLACLQMYAASAKPADIPYLCSYVLSRHEKIRQIATAVLERVVVSLAPLDYLWLDRYLRESRVASREWYEGLSPESLAAFETQGDFGPILLGLATTHANGRVRERAVRLLDNGRDGTELPFLHRIASESDDAVR